MDFLFIFEIFLFLLLLNYIIFVINNKPTIEFVNNNLFYLNKKEFNKQISFFWHPEDTVDINIFKKIKSRNKKHLENDIYYNEILHHSKNQNALYKNQNNIFKRFVDKIPFYKIANILTAFGYVCIPIILIISQLDLKLSKTL